MKVLITAGPTREALDPMRYISNRSSGKMGYALAEAAVSAGHETVLVSGPCALTPPEGLAKFVKVISAADMAEAVKAEFPAVDAAIMCAAVADYRPKTVATQKIKKTCFYPAPGAGFAETGAVLLSMGSAPLPWLCR